MAELAVSTTIGQLKVLFNKIKHVYFFTEAGKLPGQLTTANFELPIVEDTVQFNTGEPDVSRVKLTTGDTWTSIATAGDAEITLQLSTVASSLLDIFFEKTGKNEGETPDTVSLGATIGGRSFAGYGYSFSSPKKVNGGLLMTSADNEVVLYLPDVEMYSSLQTDNDVPAFINVTCTPTVDKNGVQIWVLPKVEGETPTPGEKP